MSWDDAQHIGYYEMRLLIIQSLHEEQLEKLDKQARIWHGKLTMDEKGTKQVNDELRSIRKEADSAMVLFYEPVALRKKKKKRRQ